MNEKISVLVIWIETIVYLMLYNLHNCTFKSSCFILTTVLFYDWTTSVSGQEYQIVPLSPILWFFNLFRVNIPFHAPWKHQNSVVSKGYKKVTLSFTGLILVVCRNYNVLQSFCFEKYWLEKETYISKIWNFKFCIFNSKLIFRIL